MKRPSTVLGFLVLVSTPLGSCNCGNGIDSHDAGSTEETVGSKGAGRNLPLQS